MTDDLRDLLARAGRDEASAARREDFHGAFGDVVRGRVKRRRAVRAAGVGSVAAVSVGAIAFGAVRLPGMSDAGPQTGDTPGACVADAAATGEWSVDVAEGGGVTVTGEPQGDAWVMYDHALDKLLAQIEGVDDDTVRTISASGLTAETDVDDTGMSVHEIPTRGWIERDPYAELPFTWTEDIPHDATATDPASAMAREPQTWVQDAETNLMVTVEPDRVVAVAPTGEAAAVDLVGGEPVPGKDARVADDGAVDIEIDGTTLRIDAEHAPGAVWVWIVQGDGMRPLVISGGSAGDDCATPTPAPDAVVDACVDGTWRIDAEVLRPDLVYGVTNTENPDSQESSTPGVAIQPMLLGQRVITVVLDTATGEALAMLEAADSERELRVRLSEGDALRVAQDDDGAFTFQLLDGRWMTVADDDGPWNGQDVVGLSGEMPAAVSPSAAPDDGVAWGDFSREIAEDFDLEWPASPWVCVESRTGDGDEESSAAPSSAPSAGTGVEATTSSSPYQCGYVFETPQHRTDEWAIETARWRDGEEVWTMLDEWYVDPLSSFLVEPSGPVASFEAEGTFFDARGVRPARGGNGLDADDGIFHDVWYTDGFGSQSLTFVATVDGRVVAVADQTPKPSGVIVDSNAASHPTSAFLLDVGALEPCAGVTPEQVVTADIVAVSAAAARDRDGDIEVQYVWETLGRP